MLFSILLNGANMNVWTIAAGIIASLISIFVLLPVHEFAHAKTAVILGDNTPKYSGRLSLNPFAHIDFLGAALLILFGFGWARPVGINMHNFKNPKRDMAITALAGPVSNLVVALAVCILANVFFLFDSMIAGIIGLILNSVAYISVSLAVFNFLPVPPLDGSRLLTALLPDRTYYKLMQYERYFPIIIIGVIYLMNQTGIFSSIVSGLLSLIYLIANLPFMLF